MTRTVMSVLELSSGSRWKPASHEPPYLLATTGDPWPTDALAYVVFTNTAGSQLAIFDLDVTAGAILPNVDAEDVESIPAGANFEIFLDTVDGGTDKIRYGKVIRREVTYPDAPAAQAAAVALRYVDTFPTLGVRSNWKPILNRVKIWDNIDPLPNAMATESAFFATAAVRWDAPLNSDSPRVHVQLLNQGAGKTAVILCADQRLTSYVAVVFEEGGLFFPGNTRIHLATGSGPITRTDRVAPLAHTVVDLDDYTIGYDNVTGTLMVYAGTDTTPLTSWTDVDNIVPHGPGYRYLGLSWEASLFDTGIQVCSWNAKDDV